LAALAVVSHVVGLVVLPSLLWLLSRTGLAKRVSGRRGARLLLAAALLLAAGAAGRAVSGNLEAQLLFVPPWPTRFSAPGYTLFSVAHLADLVNLALLLVPGALVLAAALRSGVRPGLAADPALRFLAVLAISAAGPAFVIDPKLGMPRDWDLFSFAGVPIAVAAWVALLGRGDRAALRSAGLAATLGFLVLLSRALTNADEDAAYRRFRAHLDLDPARARAARFLAVQYLRRIGAEDLALAEAEQWDRDYPERVLGREALEARSRGDLDEAIRLNRAAIERAPAFSDPWNNLASCLLAQGDRVRAREALEVARALNPNEPSIWLNLGTHCFAGGDLEGAAKWWTRAWERAPDGALTNHFLARLAEKRGDDAGYERHLRAAAASPEAPAKILREWAERLESGGQIAEAREVRRRIVERAPDEAAESAVPGSP
jgi:Flp pilus assembly protein TadD